jgi:ADP-ribose pyrophosphatase YjhB (NUDIX family)
MSNPVVVRKSMVRRPFEYCPYCAAQMQDLAYGRKILRSCPACHFVQHHDPKVAVIARIEHGDRLLLVRRGVDPGKGLWALPGGYMDAGEMPEDALHREIAEEVDLAITVHELLAIYPMINANLPSQGIVLVYRATPAEPVQPLDCELAALDDVVEARWFAVGTLPIDLAFASTEVEVRRWTLAFESDFGQTTKHTRR